MRCAQRVELALHSECLVRRASYCHGFDYPLQPPEAAIDPSEDAVSIDVAISLRAAFAQDDRPESRVVLAFLDTVHGLLTGRGVGH